ncbi:MAG: dipeptidase [Myxococcales bacterium]|nr:dipeptidase [Myxococcales bacterium]
MPIVLVLFSILVASPTIDLNLFHGQTLIIDLHVDTLYQLKKRPQTSFLHGPLDLTKHAILRSGLNAQFFSVWVPDQAVKKRAAERYAWDLIRIFDRLLRQNTGWMRQASSVGEIELAFRDGKFAALLGMEGAAPLGRSPSKLRAFARRGVRYLGITWNRANAFGDPAVGPKPNGGLSVLGRELIREANRLSVMPDVSHASVATFWDVLRVSRKPVIASHSNALSLCRHPRNLDDEQLKALARSGGVIGVNFFSRYLTGSRHASIADIVRHARYIADLVGWEHVALGSDLDGSIIKPVDFRSIADLPRLTEAFLQSGVSAAQLRKMYGANLLATMRRSEAPPSAPRAMVPLAITLRATPKAPRCLASMIDRNRLTSCAVPLPSLLGSPSRAADLVLALPSRPTQLGLLAVELDRHRYRVRREQNRVKSVHVALFSGDRRVYQTRWNLRDSRQMQLLSIPKPNANRDGPAPLRLELRILELYRGERPTRFAVISEIVAYGP